jgi:hypothetical protein
MAFVLSLLTVGAGVALVLSGLLVYAMWRDHADRVAPTHQQQFDDDPHGGDYGRRCS